VPELIKATSTSTTGFEMATCAEKTPAFAFSSYTVSLALASHSEVDGWDTDVIAEDHHMTCKCFFAALWEQFHDQQQAKYSESRGDRHTEVPKILPQLQVKCVPLPSLCYLVESKDGLWASIVARFQQARRHMQGIVEIGYLYLQYFRLIQQAGFANIPAQTHFSVCARVLQLTSIHTMCTAHGLCMIVGVAFRVVPMVLSWMWEGILLERVLALLESAYAAAWVNSDVSLRTVLVIASEVSLGVWLYILLNTLVVKDLVEGRYHKVLGQWTHDIAPVAEGDESVPLAASTSSSASPEGPSPAKHTKYRDGIPAVVRGPMTWWQGIQLNLHITWNTNIFGMPSMLIFAIIPSVMASFSLLRRGTDFEYIVATKPE